MASRVHTYLICWAMMSLPLDSDDASGSRHEAKNVTVANMTIVVGRSVDIPCSTDTSESVRWTYQQDQAGKDEIELYFNYLVINGHAARFEVRRPSERNFALTIKSTLMSDSGTYECRDDNGGGETVIRTVLTVINNTEDTTLAGSLSTNGVEDLVQTTQNMYQETAPDVTTSPSSMDLKKSQETSPGAPGVTTSPPSTVDLNKSQDKNIPAIVLAVVLSLVIVIGCIVVVYKFRHPILKKFDVCMHWEHRKNRQQSLTPEETNQDSFVGPRDITIQLTPLLSVRTRQNSSQGSVHFTNNQNDEATAASVSALPTNQIDMNGIDDNATRDAGHNREKMPEDDGALIHAEIHQPSTSSEETHQDDQTVASLHEGEMASNIPDQDDETQQSRSTEDQSPQHNYFHRLPLEMSELLLLKSFVKLNHDTYRSSRRTCEAVAAAYANLATVCDNWMNTLKGWPQSPTKSWVKHKLRRAIESACRPYSVFPRLEIIQPVRDVVFGLTVCDDKLVVAYTLTETVDVLELHNQQQQPKSFQVNGMKHPQDIVACTETQNIYIAGHKEGNTQCVWRISPSGNVAEWLPDNLISVHARSTLKYMSIRSRRLLVACPETNTMVVYGPDAAELTRISSSVIKGLLHAVETSRGTFIASHLEPKPSVTEINDGGNVIRSFGELLIPLETPIYLALDSEDRIFVLDKSKWRVLLLNSDLTLERILLEKKDMGELPLRMCYVETVGRLFVGDSYSSVRAFSIRSPVQR